MAKRRKQKAIAYERQLAPLMARETKQKSGASSSNTIKPGYARTEEKGGRRWRRNKEAREQWRAGPWPCCCFPFFSYSLLLPSRASFQLFISPSLFLSVDNDNA